MSEKKTETSNVLPFRSAANRAAPEASSAAELQELLALYDQLIVLLRETDDEGIDAFTDDLVIAVVRCREALAEGMEEARGQAMLKDMREELRQFPRTLRSLLPGIGPRLGESMERKLGIQFSRL